MRGNYSWRWRRWRSLPAADRRYWTTSTFFLGLGIETGTWITLG